MTMQESNLKVPYRIEVLEGTRVEKVQKWERGKGFYWVEEEIPNGFLVYLPPQWDSVPFKTEKELRDAGFNPHGPDHYVNMETGDTVAMPESGVVKRKRAATARSASS